MPEYFLRKLVCTMMVHRWRALVQPGGGAGGDKGGTIAAFIRPDPIPQS